MNQSEQIELTITIPQKVSLNSIYSGMRWKTRSELATLYHEELLEIKGKVKVKTYPVKIRYEFYFRIKPLDSLNTAFMAKMLEDGLVHSKVLVDDAPAYVTESTLAVYIRPEIKNDMVVILIQ